MTQNRLAWMFRIPLLAAVATLAAFSTQVERLPASMVITPARLTWMGIGIILVAIILAATTDARLAAWMERFQQAAAHPLMVVLALALVVAGGVIVVTVPGYTWLAVYTIFLGLYLYWLGRDHLTAFTVITIGAIITAQAVRVVYLYTVPPFNDEGLYLTIGEALRTGEGLVPAAAYLRPTIPIYPWWGYSVALYGYWTELFGATLVSTRWLSYLLSLLMLVPFYGAARLLFGHRVALASVALASWSWMFFYATRGRNYGFPMLITALVITLHIVAQRKSDNRLHLLVGLMCLLLLEGHSLMIVIAFALAAWYAGSYLLRAIQQRRLLFADPMWYFVVGSVTAALLYLGIHVFLPGIDEFQRITSAVRTPHRSGTLSLLFPPLSLWDLRLYLAQRPRSAPGATIEWLVIAASLVVALVAYRKKAAYWLIMLGLLFVGYSLFDGRGHFSYTVFMVPLAFIGAGLLALPTDDGMQPTGQVAFMLLLAIFASFQLSWTVRNAEHGLAEQRAIAQQMPAIEAAYPQRSDEFFFGEARIIGLAPKENIISISDYSAEAGGYMNNISFNAYWADAILKEWPIGLMYTQGARQQHTVFAFFTARQAAPIDPDSRIIVELVPQVPFTRVAERVNFNSTAPAQLVGYTPLPPEAQPGDTLTLEAIWLPLRALEGAITAQAHLTPSTGDDIPLGEVTVIPQGPHRAHIFLHSEAPLPLPSDLPPGAYTLSLTLRDGPTYTLGTIIVRS